MTLHGAILPRDQLCGFLQHLLNMAGGKMGIALKPIGSGFQSLERNEKVYDTA